VLEDAGSSLWTETWLYVLLERGASKKAYVIEQPSALAAELHTYMIPSE
jgi:hypothetical protein